MRTRALTSVLLAVGLAACTDRAQTAKVSGSVVVRLPVVGADGVTGIGDVTLEGITDLTEVRGHYAQFYFAPRILETGLDGDTPHARFVKTGNGVFVPADETTQHLAMIYAQTQEMAKFDARVGVDQVLQWPRAVGIAVRMKDAGQSVSDNSFYDGDSDALLVVPYKSGSLPLALNPGVLAHEHFHALFDRIVLRGLLKEGRVLRRLKPTAHDEATLRGFFAGGEHALGDSRIGGVISKTGGDEPLILRSVPTASRELYYSVLLKAVNEGLADVWGWIHTGDRLFLSRSLIREGGPRDLRFLGMIASAGRLVDAGTFRSQISPIARAMDPERNLNATSYLRGTDFSRVLLHILGEGQQNDEEEFRLAVARRLMKALPRIGVAIRASEKDLGFADLLALILEAEPMTDAQKTTAEPWIGSGAR